MTQSTGRTPDTGRYVELLSDRIVNLSRARRDLTYVSQVRVWCKVDMSRFVRKYFTFRKPLYTRIKHLNLSPPTLSVSLESRVGSTTDLIFGFLSQNFSLKFVCWSIRPVWYSDCRRRTPESRALCCTEVLIERPGRTSIRSDWRKFVFI